MQAKASLDDTSRGTRGDRWVTIDERCNLRVSLIREIHYHEVDRAAHQSIRTT